MRRAFVCFRIPARFRRRPVPARALLAAMRVVWVSTMIGALHPAAAQPSLVPANRAASNVIRPPVAPLNNSQPVTFIADRVEYDRDGGLVTATGHVEAWQNDHVLRADRITFDRNTNVAAARGNVVLMEPDGQVVFAEYAELTQGMKEGVLTGMRAQLAQNGRLAANGMRRTDGKLNELSRVVYSTCNACEMDPLRPPLWQLRAATAVQDNENKRIEYYDGVLEMGGVPVGYFPYFSHADPSVKRSSGLLIPSMGASSHVGFFAAQPYYWVIDDQSDLTITPMITAQAGPQLSLEYRRRFNNGEISIDGSINPRSGSTEGALFAHGRFNIDPNWRVGFDVARTSSSNSDCRPTHRKSISLARRCSASSATKRVAQRQANAPTVRWQNETNVRGQLIAIPLFTANNRSDTGTESYRGKDQGPHVLTARGRRVAAARCTCWFGEWRQPKQQPNTGANHHPLQCACDATLTARQFDAREAGHRDSKRRSVRARNGDRVRRPRHHDAG